jgi:O-antigen/teichoic acid export membrane protein
MSDIQEQVAAGITKEKNRESLAVFMVIGDMFVSFLLGSATSPGWGILLMLALLVPIWRVYSSSRS